MPSELKPCPFCKEQERIFVQRSIGDAYWGKCLECGAEGPLARTEQEAITAWNTRTERTCKPIDEYFCGVPSCGNCGVTLNMVTSGVRPFNKVLPNYCHNCGAKVVSDKDTNVPTKPECFGEFLKSCPDELLGRCQFEDECLDAKEVSERIWENS